MSFRGVPIAAHTHPCTPTRIPVSPTRRSANATSSFVLDTDSKLSIYSFHSLRLHITRRSEARRVLCNLIFAGPCRFGQVWSDCLKSGTCQCPNNPSAVVNDSVLGSLFLGTTSNQSRTSRLQLFWYHERCRSSYCRGPIRQNLDHRSMIERVEIFVVDHLVHTFACTYTLAGIQRTRKLQDTTYNMANSTYKIDRNETRVKFKTSDDTLLFSPSEWQIGEYFRQSI